MSVEEKEIEKTLRIHIELEGIEEVKRLVELLREAKDLTASLEKVELPEVEAQEIEEKYISSREFRLRSMIKDTFTTGDLYISFLHSQDIQMDKKQVWEEAKEFIRQLRKAYERSGAECKYIYWVEGESDYATVKILLKGLENHLEEIRAAQERAGLVGEILCTELEKVAPESLAEEIMKQGERYVVSHEVKRS